MIAYRSALEILKSEARTHKAGLSFDDVSFKNVLGRRLAQDILSPESLPAFNNSAMDGFAVRSQDAVSATREFPVDLLVVHSMAAGDMFSSELNFVSSTCCEIMTGARVPDFFDAVVKVEDVEVLTAADGTRRIRLHEPLKSGSNMRLVGEDFVKGCYVARKGDKVTPMQVMAMGALGISSLSVYRPLKIALLSTGKELIEGGGPVGESQIRNSTAPFLMALMNCPATRVEYHGIIRDEPGEFIKSFEKIIKTCPDVIITTGAVSVGKYDFVQSALTDMGAQTLFHKVAMRPGKPILFAHFENGPVVFGLPGNPVSTAVGARFFVEPYIHALLSEEAEPVLSGRLAHNVPKPEGLRCFFKAKLEISPEGTELHVHRGQASFMIQPLLESDVWAVLPEEGTELALGTAVNFVPLYGPIFGQQFGNS
jgi:molybdopterin molybdotransferase